MITSISSESVTLVSPPVWGAWIEILIYLALSLLKPVAPRMGGVD